MYQSKVHSSLVSIHNCKMVYWTRLSYTESLIVCVLFFVSSGSAGYQYSTNTFLYSLKNYKGYGYFKQDISNGYYQYATYSKSYYGPTFGGGFDMNIANNAGRNTNLSLIVTRSAAVPIATIGRGPGLEHDTEIISAQMSWRFIMKCLLETGRQHKTKKA